MLARYRAVVPLVDGREDVAVRFHVFVHGDDVGGLVVGEAEALEVASGVEGLDAAEGGGEGDGGVGRVDVEDVDLDGWGDVR